MARKSSKKNPVDVRIEKLYHERCSGVQLNIMDLPKVWKYARSVAETGVNDVVLGDSIAAFVEKIRTN